MAEEQSVGINFFIQAAAVMRESPGADAASEYVTYAKADAKTTVGMMKALPEPIKTTNFFEQANASMPLFAEMCRRAKFADHDGYLTLEAETADFPDGKLVCFVEAGDDMYSLLEKLAIEWGDG